MINHRIIERPAFDVIGRKTWISGQDNKLFGRFWVQCQEEGLFTTFVNLSKNEPGTQTGSSVLGISCVEEDPTNRTFYYIIAIEKPRILSNEAVESAGLEPYHILASRWAVFECVGKIPEVIVEAEIYAFTEWLPSSMYEHANAPEMEVYFPGNDGMSEASFSEFWLPVRKR